MIDPDDSDAIHHAAIAAQATMRELAERIRAEDIQAYAVVGELVVKMTTLDEQLNRVLIAVLALGAAVFLEGVVATLDLTRKIEILKRGVWLIKCEHPMFAKDVSKYCEQVEQVRQNRDIVCHTPSRLHGSAMVFAPVAAAKWFKWINAINPQAAEIPVTKLNDLKAAIQTGDEALELGRKIIDDFSELNNAPVAPHEQGNLQ